jgi:ankyrin repeat protein
MREGTQEFELYQLIKEGKDKEASELIAAGVNFTVISGEIDRKMHLLHETAFTLAIMLGKSDLVLQMVNKVKGILLYDVIYMAASKLHYFRSQFMSTKAEQDSVLKNYERVLDIIISTGADINVANRSGETALMVAANQNLEGMVQQLLLAGADINAINRNGKTSLIQVAEANLKGMLQQLLLAGADINAIDRWGKTALSSAAVISNRDEVVRILLLAGADLSIKDKNGYDVLDVALPSSLEQIEAYKKDPFSFYMDNLSDYLALRHISMDALPDLAAKQSPEAIKKFFKQAIEHKRADLIYQIISRYSENENVALALADKELVNKIRDFIVNDKRNDKAENLKIFAFRPMQESFEEMAAAKKIIAAMLNVVKALRGPEEEGMITVLKAYQTALDVQIYKGKITIKKNGELIRTIPHNLKVEEILSELLLGAIDEQDYLFAANLMKEQQAQLGIRKKEGISYFYYIADRYYALSQVSSKDELDKITLANLKELYRAALLDNSVDINSIIPSSGQTLLHSTAAMGLEAEAAILILRGIDPQIKDKNGKVAGDYYKAIGFNFLKMSAAEILKNEKVMREVLKSYSVEEIEKIVQATGKPLDEASKAQLNGWAAEEVASTQAPRIVKETKEHKAQEVVGLDDAENQAREKPKQPYEKAVEKLCDRIFKHAGEISKDLQESIKPDLAMIKGELPNKTWDESVSHGPARLDYQPPKASDRRMFELDKLSTVIGKLEKNDGSNRAFKMELQVDLAKIYSTHKIEKIRGDSSIERS